MSLRHLQEPAESGAVQRALSKRTGGKRSPHRPARATRTVKGLLSYRGIPSRWAAPDLHFAPSVVIPMHVARDGLDLRLFSTVTTVGAPRDITVQELRIECFIPADDTSERALELLVQTLSDSNRSGASGRGRLPPGWQAGTDTAIRNS